MDAYTFGLALGAVGLAAMAIGGLSHSTHIRFGRHGHAGARSRRPSPRRWPRRSSSRSRARGERAPGTTPSNITSVIQSVLAAQLVAKSGILDTGTKDGGQAAPAAPQIGSPPRRS